MTITYRHDGLEPFKITVKLDGRVIGSIRRRRTNLQTNVRGTWMTPIFEYVYRTKSGALGETFASLELVKRSIEEM